MSSIVQRWQTHASSAAAAADDSSHQCVVPELPAVPVDGEVDRLASALSGQLQVAAGTDHEASSKTMSKKEHRQARKVAKMQKKLQPKDK